MLILSRYPKESKDCDEKDEDTSIPRDDSHSSILEACGISNSGPSKAHVINAEKLVFGATLSKHHVANIEVTFNYVLRFGYVITSQCGNMSL